MYRIYLSPPHITGAEQQYLLEALASNWITTAGPQLEEFAHKLSALHHGISVTLCNSGTASLHMGLKALGVGEGDLVLCSTFTFAASVFPVQYLNAEPVFIDSEPDTWNMSPELLEKALSDLTARGKKPKAIVLVQLYGHMARMQELTEIAARWNVPILEDAAEALGSSLHTKPAGTFGDVSILSFNGNKIVTTSGGGALMSRNAELVKKVHFWSTQSREKEIHYEHKETGYNYRMSNISAALGIAQLESLSERILRRRKNFHYYREHLSQCSFHTEQKGEINNRWLSCALLKNKSPYDVVQALHAVGIEARPLWKPMHLQPVFSGATSYLNGTSEAFFKTGICLPSGSDLTGEQLKEIVELVKE